jgi:hypothetical protein
MNLPFRSAAVTETKKWLRDHFNSYPRGIGRVYEQRRSGEVHVSLEDPLDIDYLKRIAEAHGYDTDLSTDDGTAVLNLYDVIEDGGTVVTKTLDTVFREQRDVSIGSTPVHGTDIHPRLLLVCDYLRGKYD